MFDTLMKAGSVLVYKHSSSCPVSFRARREVAGFAELAEAPDIYEVLVIEQRGLSDYVAEVTGVRHQSPQAILLQEGRVIWHGSHFKIDMARLRQVSCS